MSFECYAPMISIVKCLFCMIIVLFYEFNTIFCYSYNGVLSNSSLFPQCYFYFIVVNFHLFILLDKVVRDYLPLQNLVLYFSLYLGTIIVLLICIHKYCFSSNTSH